MLRLFRFFVSSADSSATETLALLWAANDGEAFDRGFDIIGAARANELGAEYDTDNPDEDEAGFFSAEEMEDADRLADILADIPALRPALGRSESTAQAVATALLKGATARKRGR